MKEKTKEAWRTLTLGVSVTIAIMCIVLDIMMLKSLITPWWIPVACVLPVAICLALPLRSLTRWLTGLDKIWLNTICHTLLLSPILLLAVLTLNMIYTRGEQSMMPAIIERVYTENRKHTRRVGRRHYSSYTSLHHVINVTMPDGEHRKIDIPRKLYNKVSKGDTVDIPVTTGIFHLVQLDESHLKPRHPEAGVKSRKKKRSSFGTVSGRSPEEVREYYRHRVDSIRNRFKH